MPLKLLKIRTEFMITALQDFFNSSPENTYVVDKSFSIGFHRWVYFLAKYKPEKVIIPCDVFADTDYLNYKDLACFYCLKNGEYSLECLEDLIYRKHPICDIIKKDTENILRLIDSLKERKIAIILDYEQWPLADYQKDNADFSPTTISNKIHQDMMLVSENSIRGIEFSPSDFRILSGVIYNKQSLVSFSYPMKSLVSFSSLNLPEENASIPFINEIGRFNSFVDQIYNGDISKIGLAMEFSNSRKIPKILFSLIEATGMEVPKNILNAVMSGKANWDIWQQIKDFLAEYKFNCNYTATVMDMTLGDVQYIEEASSWLGLGPYSKGKILMDVIRNRAK